MYRILSHLPLFLVFVCLASATIDYDQEYNAVDFTPEHSNEWVVRIDEGTDKDIVFARKYPLSRCLGDDVADLVAKELGLENKRRVR